MSKEQKFKVALSREALKYYDKVSTSTAERLDKCLLISWLDYQKLDGLY